MESKKNNYKQPDTLVVEIQHHGHLLGGTGDPQHPGSSQAREQNSNWSSED